MELGFIIFKSNDTKAKRPLQHIQKPHKAKKKAFFFFNGFPWGFCMDCLRNQQMKNLPGNGMGDGFSWESNGDCNNNNSNNKLIRIVPALNESGRGNNGLFGDSLLWKATSMRVAEETMAFLGILSCGRQLQKWLFHGRVKGSGCLFYF